MLNELEDGGQQAEERIVQAEALCANKDPAPLMKASPLFLARLSQRKDHTYRLRSVIYGLEVNYFSLLRVLFPHVPTLCQAFILTD